MPFVHTKNENITINGKLSDFENKYNDHLLRIHTSFLVNPSCVTKIERFNVQLQDGTILPIPEKNTLKLKKLFFLENSSIQHFLFFQTTIIVPISAII